MVNEKNRSYLTRIQNAYIERIFRGKRVVLLTVSYVEQEETGILNIRIITMVLSNSTRAKNQYGQRMWQDELKEGMKIDALISKVRTASIPTQVRAYKILARVDNNNACTKVDKVVIADLNYEYVITGGADALNSQLRFNIAPNTKIIDNKGKSCRPNQLKTGQIVKIRHTQIENNSIPPQAAAITIQILGLL